MSKHLGFGPLFDDAIASRSRKSARRCGAKHIWKSKVSKTEGFEPLLLCLMSFYSTAATTTTTTIIKTMKMQQLRTCKITRVRFQLLCWSLLDSHCFFRIPTTNISYRFPILKLPPPPCAVLLVLIFKY